jgi:hypothetical protein
MDPDQTKAKSLCYKDKKKKSTTYFWILPKQFWISDFETQSLQPVKCTGTVRQEEQFVRINMPVSLFVLIYLVIPDAHWMDQPE